MDNEPNIPVNWAMTVQLQRVEIVRQKNEEQTSAFNHRICFDHTVIPSDTLVGVVLERSVVVSTYGYVTEVVSKSKNVIKDEANTNRKDNLKLIISFLS